MAARPMSLRMQIKNSDPVWVKAQRRAFTMWANAYLKQGGANARQIEDLKNDLAGGDVLCDLVECLTGEKLPRAKMAGKDHDHVRCMENANIALSKVKEYGVRVATTASDVVNAEEKMVLALMFQLVRAFHVTMSESKDKKTLSRVQSSTTVQSERAMLMDWVNETVAPYDLNISDFTTSLQDGRVLCALVDVLRPGLVNVRTLNAAKKRDNLSKALQLADEHLGIPMLLHVDDVLCDQPDDLSMITYLSYFRRVALAPSKPLHASGSVDQLVAVAKKESRSSTLWMGAGALLMLATAGVMVAFFGVPEGVSEHLPRSWTRPS